MAAVRNILTGIIVAFLIIAGSPYVYSHENQWEPIENVGDDAKPVSRQPDVAVFTAPSVIKVSVAKPLKIEIFTILGKLVSTEQLQAGNYEFKMNSHGVYIVKVGDLTCKVAV